MRIAPDRTLCELLYRPEIFSETVNMQPMNI